MTSSLRPVASPARALPGGDRGPLVAVAALTAIAFALRLPGIDQTLYADEYFTHTIVSENGLRGVLSQVYHTSITPPLHYVLAWFSIQFGGDSTVLIRLPSLIFGTALVPVVYLLGRRIGGTRVGLLAATLIALSPQAIWYSDEARNYATMMFFVAMSTLALLRAVDDGGRRWLVVYAVTACAALWCHYTAVFVLAAQAGWALWSYRDRWRELAFADAAIVLGYLPWLPGFIEQRRNHTGIEILDVVSPITFGRVFIVPLRTLIGHPFYWLKEFPGDRGLVLAGFLLVLVIGAAVGRHVALRRPVPSLRSKTSLAVLLAIATPVGLLLYAAAGSSLYLARNLSASLPGLAVLAALALVWLASAAPPRVAALSLAGIVGALAVGAISTVVDKDQHRPAYREVAHYLDRVAPPRDPVLETTLNTAADKRFLKTTLDLYFRRPHPLYPTGAGEDGAWRQLQDGRSLYAAVPSVLTLEDFLNTQLKGGRRVPADLARRFQRLGGPDGLAVARSTKRFPGIFPITVTRYQGLVHGRLERHGSREIIQWSLGGRVAVSPGAMRGEVDNLVPTPYTIAGWALDRANRPADWVLFFDRDRLFAVASSAGQRPDIAKQYGASALISGFARSLTAVPRDPSKIRVFAVTGRSASELPLAPAVRRALR